MRPQSSRRHVAALSLALAAALTACATKSSADGAFTPEDSAAVRASAELWRTKMVEGDFDAWAKSVTEDAVLYPPNSKPVVGRNAAIAFAKAYPKITKFDINIEEMVGRGDAATDRGTFTLTAQLPNGMAVNDTGSFLSLFRRQADGTWAHSRVMWHSDLPAPPAPPPATAATSTRRSR
jgi:ketosteroid isomerase-like protein